MPLLIDEPLDFLGFGKCMSRCRLRIFTPPTEAREDGYIVILVDDEQACGTSLTNVAERLAAEVCRRYHIPPERAVGFWSATTPDTPSAATMATATS